MATERLLMRHIREILRLKWTLRRSHRETARSLGISAGLRRRRLVERGQEQIELLAVCELDPSAIVAKVPFPTNGPRYT